MNDTQTTPVPDVLTLAFDGSGGAERRGPDDMPMPSKGGSRGFVWQHLRRDGNNLDTRLVGLGLDRLVIDALTADETRPRCTVHDEGVLLNLRGVNLNPGAEPEDMVSVRLWLEAGRVIGVWVRWLNAVEDLIASCDRGQAPVSPGDFVARLALRVADRAEPAVAEMNEEVDRLEEIVLDANESVPRSDLSAIRRKAIMLRRYMMPQRDALTTLEIEDLDWLRDHDRARLREAAERIYRLGEELDAIRDRAQVLQDHVMDHRAERMNTQMLLLAVVTTLFLPLSLITGLLGINVGGVPGAQDPMAFWVVCAVLVLLGAAGYWFIRRTGLFR